MVYLQMHVSLLPLLFAGSTTLAKIGETRKDLRERVGELSVDVAPTKTGTPPQFEWG
jgi:hypothetical protein